MFNNLFPPPLKSCRLWDNVEKCCRAGQATDDTMTHAHCVLDTYSYKYTQYLLLFTATMVTRTHVIVTSHEHRLSCATFRPPKVTPVSAFREVHTRTLNGQSTVSASRRHIAAVLVLSPPDVCAESSTPVNQTDLSRLLLLLLLLLYPIENGRLTGLVTSYVETAFCNKSLKER